MIIRSILAEELSRFAEISNPPARRDRFFCMVSAMWEAGESQPEWCFVIEEDSRLLGRIGFMSVDGRSDEVAIFGWALPWDGDFLSLGTRLLEASLQELQQQGVRSVQRELYSSWGTLDQQIQTLEAAGFSLLQQQCFYDYSATSGAIDEPSSSSRLHYKLLTMVGDEQFMEVVRQATVGTLDRAMQKQIQAVGLEAFVQQDYQFIRNEHDLEPDWWRLGYTPEGELVGFFQPVRFPNSHEGNIAYLGVIPEKRGKGYSVDLLTTATSVLLQAAVKNIIARTDSQNVPMQRTFDKVGYQLESRIWVYERHIARGEAVAILF